MAWINRLELNMKISRNIYEGKSSNLLIAIAQKIAFYSIIPFVLIAFFEGIVKNFIVFNLANLGITIINGLYENTWGRLR